MAETRIDLCELGVAWRGDATPAVGEALRRARAVEGPVRLRLPEGRLHLFRDLATERFVAVSNNDSGTRRIAFDLDGIDDLTIEGRNTELVLHGALVPFDARHCRNLTLEGLTIDWDRPFTLEGEVEAVDPDAGSFDLRPSPWVLWEIRAERLWWVERRWPRNAPVRWHNRFRESLHDGRWEHTLGPSIWFDADARAIARGSSAALFHLHHPETTESYRAVDLGDGRVRLFDPRHTPPGAGWVFVDGGALRNNRRFSAIHLFRCDNVRLRDVTVRHANGMGLIAEFCENVRLEGCAVTPAPGRMCSTTADATHFVSCRGEIALLDCLFENMGDDGTNVHGAYTPVSRALDRHTLLLHLHHPQQAYTTVAFPGDEIAVVDRPALLPYLRTRVAAVEPVNGDTILLRCEDPVGESLTPDSVIENLSWQADLTVRGCRIRNNRARAVLFTTRGRGAIVDNEFENQSMASVLIDGDAALWYESGPVADLLVEGNRISHYGREFPENAAIRITPSVRRRFAAEPFHTNIRIRRNRIRSDNGRILHAASAAGLVFEGNEIEGVDGKKTLAESAFVVTHCPDAVLRNNEFIASTENPHHERNATQSPPIPG